MTLNAARSTAKKEVKLTMFLFVLSCHIYTHRLTSSGASSASLQELTLLAAARRSAAAAAAVAAAGGGGGVGSGGSHSMSMGVGMPSSGVGPGELHPAYRLNPYTIEHLYSSLHSSPTASLRGLSPLDPRGKNFFYIFFFLSPSSISLLFLTLSLSYLFFLYVRMYNHPTHSSPFLPPYLFLRSSP
jgi:hypothetical protein